jgi:hypothetical protein
MDGSARAGRTLQQGLTLARAADADSAGRHSGVRARPDPAEDQ